MRAQSRRTALCPPDPNRLVVAIKLKDWVEWQAWVHRRALHIPLHAQHAATQASGLGGWPGPAHLPDQGFLDPAKGVSFHPQPRERVEDEARQHRQFVAEAVQLHIQTCNPGGVRVDVGPWREAAEPAPCQLPTPQLANALVLRGGAHLAGPRTRCCSADRQRPPGRRPRTARPRAVSPLGGRELQHAGCGRERASRGGSRRPPAASGTGHPSCATACRVCMPASAAQAGEAVQRQQRGSSLPASRIAHLTPGSSASSRGGLGKTPSRE